MISSPPVKVAITPSRWLIVFISTSHAAVTIALFYAAIPQFFTLVGVLVACFSLAWSLRQHYLASPTQLQWIDGQWSVIQKDKQHLIRLRSEVVVLPFLIAIQYKTDFGKYSNLVLLNDSSDADSLRHLRVRLRLVS